MKYYITFFLNKYVRYVVLTRQRKCLVGSPPSGRLDGTSKKVVQLLCSTVDSAEKQEYFALEWTSMLWNREKIPVVQFALERVVFW